MRFEAEAAVGNADGLFDAAYGFGEEAIMTGTPEEIGAAVTRFLASLDPADCEKMRYGTATSSFGSSSGRPQSPPPDRAVGALSPPDYPHSA